MILCEETQKLDLSDVHVFVCQMSTSEKDLVTVRRQYLRHKWTACSSTDERSHVHRETGRREGGRE